MKTYFKFISFLTCFFVLGGTLFAQKSKKENLIYVDKGGVMKYTKDGSEAAFFGVNYTAPFAYSYRAHKALGINIKQAIQQDVYHLSRLGIDAFRVHVWDTEITDSLGNLLQNEHLDLFDFLLAELEKRSIKIIITPIAFWGNGYPQPDEKTAGFSSLFNKDQGTSVEKAIQAQERYLKQFFVHINPYTHLSYLDDQSIIATEINNEPKHSGSKKLVTNYINRLNDAIRDIGWTKPIFYNISQTPSYAAAVANSKVDGFSFQWYPSGLVANHERKGNFLPHVDRYPIPFDSISSFAKRAKMVYEFDAADILKSYLYPAMAKSFRTAGFQWATQFAYDPMALAYANTEYQTHYLNLAYTPSKAISLLIASKAFHLLPRLKNYGSYPKDSVFNVFRVSYQESLSEMNSATEFYYSNSTHTIPVNLTQLKKIAGVGNSATVKYAGSGAYFLDKLENGNWRLEVMPDAVNIRDPFENSSPHKEVTRMVWNKQLMNIQLPDLGDHFAIKPLNQGNAYYSQVEKGSFEIEPDVYMLSAIKSQRVWDVNSTIDNIKIGEFVAPKPVYTSVYLKHQPHLELTEGKLANINATVVGLNANAKVTLYVNSPFWRTLVMDKIGANEFHTQIPLDLMISGKLSYFIVVENGTEFYSFPANHQGNPFAWDNHDKQSWTTYIAAQNSDLEIYNPNVDQTIIPYPLPWESNVKNGYTSAKKANQLIWFTATEKLTDQEVMGFQFYFADKLSNRLTELSKFKKLVISIRTNQKEDITARFALIDKDATSFAVNIPLKKDFTDIEIPLNSLKVDAELLLPRPYPDFMPLWFKSASQQNFQLHNIEKVEITMGPNSEGSKPNQPYRFEIESIKLTN